MESECNIYEFKDISNELLKAFCLVVYAYMRLVKWSDRISKVYILIQDNSNLLRGWQFHNNGQVWFLAIL